MKKSLCLDGLYMKDELILEILSRLPPKSLMRFKCVSKNWLYFIEEDKYLHSSHSLKSHQKLLITTSLRKKHNGHNFFSLDLFQPNKSDRYVKRYLQQWEEGGRYRILVSPYGLVCYVNYHDFSVRIYNNCIREKTPWITKDRSKLSYAKNPASEFGLNQNPVCGFGFDPITQKHKVVFMWSSSVKKRYKYRNFEEMSFYVCEVLTVGENIWRTIETDTRKITVKRDPVYANGFLYWLENPFSPDSILSFDVGKEKLRVINYSNDIFKSRLPGSCLPGATCIENLLEVDGHLALIDQCCHLEDGIRWSKTEMKLWIFNEDGKENKWIEEPIELPCHMRDNKHAYDFKSIAGTNKLIITTRPEPLSESEEDEDDNDKVFSLYIYDRKEKKLNEYGSIINPRNTSPKKFFMHPYWCEASIIVESIYPVGTRKV